jgi:hypothetical protein
VIDCSFRETVAVELRRRGKLELDLALLDSGALAEAGARVENLCTVESVDRKKGGRLFIRASKPH